MNVNRVMSVFSQLLHRFPRLEFQRAVKEHRAERHARGFTCWGSRPRVARPWPTPMRIGPGRSTKPSSSRSSSAARLWRRGAGSAGSRTPC